MKVLFIFIELRLLKKITTVKGPVRLVLWKQVQNDSWKFFSFSLNCNFQKRSLNQGQSDLDFESKTKMTAESPFHFIWIATFKQDDYNTGWPLLWKQSKMTVESPSHFNELRLCVNFCCKRKGHAVLWLEFDKLETFIFQLWVLCHFKKY